MGFQESALSFPNALVLRSNPLALGANALASRANALTPGPNAPAPKPHIPAPVTSDPIANDPIANERTASDPIARNTIANERSVARAVRERIGFRYSYDVLASLPVADWAAMLRWPVRAARRRFVTSCPTPSPFFCKRSF